MTLREAMSGLIDLPGFRYACVADPDTGRVIRESGVAPVVPETVLRWAREALETFRGDQDDGLEDLILSSHAAYHLVRPIGPRSLLLYLCVDRARSNLALSRRELATVRLATPQPGVEASAQLRTPRGRPAAEASPAAPPAAPPPLAGARPVAAASPATAMPTTAARAPTVAATPQAAAPPPVPLPRRTPGQLPPPEVPAARSAASPHGRRWADDVTTIKRLLGALRAMS